MRERDRLSLRIPWLMEAAAEGRVAIAALAALALVLLLARSFGWL